MSHIDSCCSGTSEEGEFPMSGKGPKLDLENGEEIREKKSGRREEAEGCSKIKVR